MKIFNKYASYGFAPIKLTKVVKTLLILNVGIFFLQIFGDILTRQAFTREWFGLSVVGIRGGHRYWQFFTYMFLHGNIWHLVLNMLVLVFMGPETERAVGSWHFGVLYLLSGVLGGVGWFLISYPGSPCVGASGAIFGVLGAFAALYPQRRITLLLFFILPITLKAWVLVAGLALVELFFLIFGQGGHIAYAVHLGGVIVGAVYVLIVFRYAGMTRIRPPHLRMIKGGRLDDSGKDQEVDRILDKIAQQGIHSLSGRERKMLKAVSEAKNRRH